LNAHPGPISGELRMTRYRRTAFSGEVKAKDTTQLSLNLEKLPELEPELGDTMTIPSLNLTLRGVGPGRFLMGGESQRPAHQVTITRGYWLGQTEVTQAQWQAVMGSNPSRVKDDSLPIQFVSWNDVMTFCRKLTEREHVAKRLPAGWSYTLPTEAQWEYACRAGAEGDTPAGLDSIAWYGEFETRENPHPVAQKQTNAWGFFDMLGNVSEACSDWYGPYSAAVATDPFGPDTGTARVGRGGAWWMSAEDCNYVMRGQISPDLDSHVDGFRIALRAFVRASLNITSVPSGLSFEVSNLEGYTQSGLTPAELTSVPSGEVRVRVSRPACSDRAQTVQLPVGGHRAVEVEFPTSHVEITSTPSGAEVWQGEQKLGVTPLTLTDLMSGHWEAYLKLKGHQLSMVAGELPKQDTLHLAAVLNGQAKDDLKQGEKRHLDDLNLTLISIEAGCFPMGGDSWGDGYSHTVIFTHGFWLGQTEVTQAQWQAVMGVNPSLVQGDSLPVNNVKWSDVMLFCQKLNEREQAAGRLPAGWHYTLPTEAQWEYAFRAGKTGAYKEDIKTVAWSPQNSEGKAHPVGQKLPNAWGFYDMLGNVEEWCSDSYVRYSGHMEVDPSGPRIDTIRMVRGGSFKSDTTWSSRKTVSPRISSAYRGFRLALSVDQQADSK
jgi:formylglycine-generating enzyme required for sulfatase activity